MVSKLGVLFALGLLCGSSVHVSAGPPRRDPPVQTFQQGGIGCYWHRGRHHCSRYCYLEVDGKRYCTSREREAVSQAPEMHRDAEQPGPRRGRYSGTK